MRFVLGLISGLLGMLAGWFALAMLVIGVAGPDHDGGIAMGAFFQVGPLGGVVGFAVGVFLFIKKGIVRERAAALRTAAAHSSRTRISRPFAASILVLAGGLAWWGWYELIRSPYLTHGFMTLELQFKLPPGAALPPDTQDVHVGVLEGDRQTWGILGNSWHGLEGDRHVILASATLSMKTGARTVFLEFPGLPKQIWQLDLPRDPDSTSSYAPWRFPDSRSSGTVEMNFRLSADR